MREINRLRRLKSDPREKYLERENEDHLINVRNEHYKVEEDQKGKNLHGYHIRLRLQTKKSTLICARLCAESTTTILAPSLKTTVSSTTQAHDQSYNMQKSKTSHNPPTKIKIHPKGTRHSPLLWVNGRGDNTGSSAECRCNRTQGPSANPTMNKVEVFLNYAGKI